MDNKTQAFFNPTWTHGKYLDYWSFIHFLTGFILGVGASFVSNDKFTSLVFIFILLIFYEFLETKIQVSENIINILLDMAVGSAGAYVALFFLPQAISPINIPGILSLVIILDLIFVSRGWKNFLNRKAKQGKFYSYIHGTFLFIVLFGILLVSASIYFWLAGHFI